MKTSLLLISVTLLCGCATRQIATVDSPTANAPRGSTKADVDSHLANALRESAHAEKRELSIHLAMLHSQNYEIRKHACREIPKLTGASASAGELLHVLLHDPTEYVRMAAAEALCIIGHPKLTEILETAAKSALLDNKADTDEVRAYCAGALALLAPEKALQFEPFLASFAEEEKDDINQRAGYEKARQGLAALNNFKKQSQQKDPRVN